MRNRLSVILRSLLRRRRFEDGLTEEVRFHIDECTEELVRGGMPRDEAARRARIEFGSVEAVKDDCRQARGLRLLDELSQDARYAVRVLRKSRGFTATAAATLALCLGANLAVFAVVDAILLRPLPFRAPDRLVRVFNTYPKAGVPDDGGSVTNYYERRGAIDALASVSLIREGTALVGGAGATERERVMRVTADFFTTLGSDLAEGRAFTEAEMDPGAARVAIVTDGYRRQHFSADPNVVGRTIRVDGIPRTIVGVLPPSFRFLSSKARLFFPLASSPEEREPLRRHWGSSSQMVARLKPGVSVERAQAAIDAHNASVEIGSPTAKMMAEAGFRTIVAPLHAEHVAAVRPALLLVQAGAICLLLIGAVNLVNLLLIRAVARSRELAVRQAIGGTRGRIARQVAVETTLLALTGAAAGIFIGATGTQLLGSLGAETLPLGTRIEFGARPALAGLLAALVTGVLMAVPVAWQSVRGHARAALSFESRAVTAGAGAQRLRHGFVVAQIALALGLLAGAGLLGISLRNVTAVSPGFHSTNVLAGQITLPVRTYPDMRSRAAFIDRLVAALDAQPGVNATGVVTNVPFSGRDLKSATTVKGYVPRPGESVRGHYAYGVAGRYFDALGLPLVEGRFLEPDEIRRGERVAVVDADFARRYWPGASALGRQVFPGPKAGSDAEAFTIVGVSGSPKHTGLTDMEATGTVFYPYNSRLGIDLFVVTRTAVPPDAMTSSVRRIVREVDPDLAVSDVRTMDARIADTLVARRAPALLAGLFSALALLLTAIGTYGVVGYAVAARRREIALRAALGATPQQMRRQFLALSARLVAAGCVLGLAGAWLTGRAMEALLFGVPPLHLPTLAAAAAVMCALSLVACLVPALRAARVSPLEALTDAG